MPELPEVETVRRIMDKRLRGRRVTQVLLDPKDRYAFQHASALDFRAALTGAKVVSVHRHGKYLWMKLDRKPWPVLHLGMSGNVFTKKIKGAHSRAWGGVQLKRGPKSAPVRAGEVPPYARLGLVTDKGDEVFIVDPRRFARFRLAQDPRGEAPIANLGADPLDKDFPSAAHLLATFAKRKTAIKPLLLQQDLFAGVGNWIADEVLFQSALSPHRPAASLSAVEVRRLRGKLLSILKKAVAVEADYERFPKTWLFHHRWGKKLGAQTSRALRIRHETIGGRTAAWVPEIQK